MERRPFVAFRPERPHAGAKDDKPGNNQNDDYRCSSHDARCGYGFCQGPFDPPCFVRSRYLLVRISASLPRKSAMIPVPKNNVMAMATICTCLPVPRLLSFLSLLFLVAVPPGHIATNGSRQRPKRGLPGPSGRRISLDRKEQQKQANHPHGSETAPHYFTVMQFCRPCTGYLPLAGRRWG